MGMKRKRVLFRATGGPGTGWGHVMRCLALADGLRRARWDVSFRLEDSSPDVARFVSREFPVVDARAPCDWAVFDSYALGEGDRRQVLETDMKLLCIDDQARGRFSADVILNANPGARASEYRCARPTRLLLGSRYCLLRAPFRRRMPAKRIAKRARRLLVSFGGTDPLRMADRVLSALPSGFEVRVLRGATASETAALMKWADMAVTAAGSTCWELARVGVPLLAVACAENQRRVADAVHRRGIGMSLGSRQDLIPGRLRDRLETLAADPERRERMSRKGQKIVDGRGVERVIEVMKCPRR